MAHPLTPTTEVSDFNSLNLSFSEFLTAAPWELKTFRFKVSALPDSFHTNIVPDWNFAASGLLLLSHLVFPEDREVWLLVKNINCIPVVMVQPFTLKIVFFPKPEAPTQET